MGADGVKLISIEFSQPAFGHERRHRSGAVPSSIIPSDGELRKALRDYRLLSRVCSSRDITSQQHQDRGTGKDERTESEG
jgi:hypothetical protein